MISIKKWSIMIISLMFAGCATDQRAELESADPKMAIQEVQNLRLNMQRNNVDLLAHDEFHEGIIEINEAVDHFNQRDEKLEVLDLAATAKAHFLSARTVADRNRNQIPKELLSARASAIMAGLRSNAKLIEKLDSIDSDLIDDTDNYNEKLSVEEISNYQKKYMELEVNSVQDRELAKFRDIIYEADKNNADDLAPNTYKQARSHLKIAENMIGQNPRRADEYYLSVNQTNKSAKLLDDVMTKLKGDAKGSSESVALKLVYQERKLGRLSETIGELAGDLAVTEWDLEKTSNDLVNQKSKTLSAESQVRFQTAMDSVRKNFSEDEAEVYQQGDHLIIRLKKLNFKSGSANIPDNSKALMGKVDKIISKIEPKGIEVQGHTDSTGSAEINKKLSQKRAKSVAQYLSGEKQDYSIDTIGYGSSKPLASNQSSSGRKLNRRVDIVIDAK